MPFVGPEPVHRLVLEDKRRPPTLQCARRAGDCLDALAAGFGVDDLLAQVDAELLNRARAEHPRKERHGVPRLVTRDGCRLYPGSGVCPSAGQAALPAREATRPYGLDAAERRAERVLPVTLHPPEHPVAPDEPAIRVDGIPPEQEAGLLVRELPRLASLRAVRLQEVVRRPTEDLPTQRVLRQDEPRAVALPGGAHGEGRRRPRATTGSGGGGHRFIGSNEYRPSSTTQVRMLRSNHWPLMTI